MPLVEELIPAPEPLEACARLAGEPLLFFLDSAGETSSRGRYSFLTADPPTLLRSRAGLTERLRRPGGRWVRVPGDPLAVAHRELIPWTAPPAADLPPFQGGAAGYVGYEWGAALEHVRRAQHAGPNIPDVMLGLYDWVLAWDHATDRAWIIATGMPAQGAHRARRAAARLKRVKACLDGRPSATGAATRPPRAVLEREPAAPTYPIIAPDIQPGVRSTFTRRGYLDIVARVIEYIRAGDVFQANLSQRFQAPLVGTPFDFFCRLRARNPAPFSAYAAFGDFAVASASPERFLRVHEGRVEARPIKGTRPRGAGPVEDAALAAALEGSPKDRAENAMIVDVVRNDLSRVCRPGSVRAPELFAIERYATVQHLVSTVVGELGPDSDIPELVRAAFPAGSVTGAPKVRAMQIIAELEPTARGVYCGAIGYWSATGSLDLSVAIRTCVVVGREVYFHAGGGIVAESDPAREYEETLDKARGLIAALVP